MSYNQAPQYVQKYIDQTIKTEGGYVNDADDRGGETRYGITKITAHRNGYTGPMQDLPISLARDIYAKEYYYEPNFNLISSISEPIAYELFDTGVVSGPARPSRWLQESLNVLNRDGSDYANVTEDGIIGPKTAKALQSFLEVRGERGEVVLYNLLNSIQGQFFFNLAKNDPSQQTFVYGWLSHRTDFKDFG